MGVAASASAAEHLNAFETSFGITSANRHDPEAWFSGVYSKIQSAKWKSVEWVLVPDTKCYSLSYVPALLKAIELCPAIAEEKLNKYWDLYAYMFFYAYTGTNDERGEGGLKTAENLIRALDEWAVACPTNPKPWMYKSNVLGQEIFPFRNDPERQLE